MFAVLRVDRSGRVVGVDRAGETLLGRCQGQRCCDAVSARVNRAFLCTPGCAAALADGAGGDRSELVTVRHRLLRLRCLRVGDEVVIVLHGRPTADTGPHEPLTPREREVLTLAASGASTRRMAEILGVSSSTVRTHAERAREKLGARTRAQAVAVALERGEIDGQG